MSICDRRGLTDQLIHPRFGNRTIALVVDVNAVRSPRRLPIDEHAKSHGSPLRHRCHNEMKIAGLKSVRDPAFGLIERDGLSPDRPITRKSPMIESQVRRRHIDVTLVQDRTVARHKVLGTLIADVVLRGLQVAPIGRSFRPTGINRNQPATASPPPVSASNC